MFLKITRARNPELIRTALSLHREGLVPPNCFVIDLDVVAENALLLKQAAQISGLSLYFTTKQIGFNPIVARCVAESGIPKALAIDFREASVLSQYDIPIGHIGHLVQVPSHMIGSILNMQPEVITVFSVEKAKQISRHAEMNNQHVNLLLRVVSEKDFFYPGQVGGFNLDELLDGASSLLKLPNIKIAGVTSFPCLQLDENTKTLRSTNNFYTILKAARLLREGLGIQIEQINAPGNTCVSSMEILTQMGATHGEPGHALTGTTYLHAHDKQAERPALVYVSEVSHLYGDNAFIFGGGTYRRTKIRNALVRSRNNEEFITEVVPLDSDAIDYYTALSLPDVHDIEVGNTVIVASRAQIFVSRSYVAVVQGIQTGSPTIIGIFDAWGRSMEKLV